MWFWRYPRGQTDKHTQADILIYLSQYFATAPVGEVMMGRL